VNVYSVDLNELPNGYAVGDITTRRGHQGLIQRGYTDMPVTTNDMDQIEVTLTGGVQHPPYTNHADCDGQVGRTPTSSIGVTLSP